MLAPIKVPPRLSKGIPGPRRPGQCYVLSGRFVYRHHEEPGIYLVHGVLTRQCQTPPRMGHGWVEFPLAVDELGLPVAGGVVVFDATARKFFPRDAYYEHYGVTQTVRYTAKEAGDAGLAAGGHWGPWDLAVLIPPPASRPKPPPKRRKK